jgi:hypothetical protein
VRRTNLQQAFSLFLLHSSQRMSGAPRYVIQQLEASFEKNIHASAIAKIHVQEVAVSLLKRQYRHKLLTYRFYKWVQWLKKNRFPLFVGRIEDEAKHHHFDERSLSSAAEEDKSSDHFDLGSESSNNSTPVDTKNAERASSGVINAMEQDV